MQAIAATTVQPTLMPPVSIFPVARSNFGGTNASPGGNLLSDKAEDHSDALTMAGLRSVVEELCRALSSSLQDKRGSAEVCLQRANAILRVIPLETSSNGRLDEPTTLPIDPIRGGLAPWRIRRVTVHIETNLDTTVRTKDLAALVELSSFHFCRAFRDSFGDSPHAYVTRRRIERAQGLMLTTNNSLSQVAMDCGLADQAHFNRLFRRFVGESPGAWRRARAIMVHSADAPKQVQATRLS